MYLQRRRQAPLKLQPVVTAPVTPPPLNPNPNPALRMREKGRKRRNNPKKTKRKKSMIPKGRRGIQSASLYAIVETYLTYVRYLCMLNAYIIFFLFV